MRWVWGERMNVWDILILALVGVVLWQCGIAWFAALLVRLLGLLLGLG